MDIYKLNPTEDQFIATAAYIICMICPNARAAEVIAALPKLWALRTKEDFAKFLTEWEKLDSLTQHCFAVAARIGKICPTCFAFKFDFDATKRHSCGFVEYHINT